MSLWAFPRWHYKIQESIPIGINLWRLFQLVSKLWISYFNWYWWIISQFGISRNMSSIGISKWQQELAMDFQLKSSTSFVISPMIKRDRHKWSLFALSQAHQSTKFKISWSRWRIWGLEKQRYIVPWTLVLPLCI